MMLKCVDFVSLRVTMVSETLAAHIISVYNFLDAQAEEKEGHRVYRGKLSTVVTDCGISKSFYTPIFRILYDGGYISQVDRGGRDKPSTVLLHTRPTKEVLLLTSDELPATVPLVDRIDMLETYTGGMNIVEALSSLNDRMTALEEKLNAEES